MKERENYTPEPQKEGHITKFTRRQFLVNTLFAAGVGFAFSSVHQSYETSQINGQLDNTYTLVKNLHGSANEEARRMITTRKDALEQQRLFSILTSFHRLAIAIAATALARMWDE